MCGAKAVNERHLTGRAQKRRFRMEQIVQAGLFLAAIALFTKRRRLAYDQRVKAAKQSSRTLQGIACKSKVGLCRETSYNGDVAPWKEATVSSSRSSTTVALTRTTGSMGT
eukprot:47421-Eustigmatos_ZCMA.PRE.1